VISEAAISTTSGCGEIASLGDEDRMIKIDEVARTKRATISSERF
jgi:hypothetical protein